MELTVDTTFKMTSEDICQALRQLEARRIQAILARDMPLLWQLHAPDYQLITPSGRTFSRERYLGNIESKTLRYLRWEAGDMAVRTSAQMAIVRYQVTLELDSENGIDKGTGKGSGTPFLCWHTDSYELRDGAWQAVWSQATAIKSSE
jgi:hypothetical protein